MCKDLAVFGIKRKKIKVEDLKVHSGEWIVIRGENGAGKSTLLHALMQFIKTKGTYELVGNPIKMVKKSNGSYDVCLSKILSFSSLQILYMKRLLIHCVLIKGRNKK
ncbi:ATP-binding cassette domain-containing protein [Peribacillus frigoritolerans]|nr:ATP-binding cassette domain-containing protein [Peribacillus frigoritolerans]